MSAQHLWITFAIFIVGLFFGCNLGVILFCVLQVAGMEERCSEQVVEAQNVATEG
jgi:hypothetical protein